MQTTRNSSHYKSTRNGLALALATILALLVTACGGGAATDSSNPQVFINSGSTSSTASYELAGIAVDNTGVSELVYTLNGGAEQALTLSGSQFGATLTLDPGDNAIVVTARDAAGNEGTASITVDYQAAPSSESGHPDIAARGDTIQLNGSGFGTGGSIDIGGVAASADDWNDNQVTLTIPTNAPGGPQTITVHGPYGSTEFEIFIGVDFGLAPAEDTVEELIALNLPAGTAVRLAARTFTQADPFVMLVNLSLYGQGEADTVIDTGGNYVIIEIGSGVHVTLQDLTLASDVILVRSSVPGPVAPLSAASAASSFGGLAAATDAAAVAAAAAALNGFEFAPLAGIEALVAAGGDFAAQATGSSSLTLRNATLEENVGGIAGLVTVDLLGPAQLPFPGSVHLENTTLDFPTSLAAIVTGGDITVENSTLGGLGVGFVSVAGGIDVRDSTIDGGDLGLSPFLALPFTPFIGAGDTVLLSNEITSTAIAIAVAPVWALGGGGPLVGIGASYHIEGNTFTSLDPDQADAENRGAVILGTSGVTRVVDNDFEVQLDITVASFGGSLDVRDNWFDLLGHAASASAMLGVGGVELPAHVEFANNFADWNGAGRVVVAGTHRTLVSDNEFYGAGGTALLVGQDPNFEFEAVIAGNLFTGFDAALYIEGEGAGAPELVLALNHNVFDFPIDAAGKVATLQDVEEADLNADFNQWGDEDDIAILNGWITENGTTTPGILVINE